MGRVADVKKATTFEFARRKNHSVKQALNSQLEVNIKNQTNLSLTTSVFLGRTTSDALLKSTRPVNFFGESRLGWHVKKLIGITTGDVFPQKTLNQNRDLRKFNGTNEFLCRFNQPIATISNLRNEIMK
ncbi:hypothetical protein RUM43_004407 [Polyplax serrata]|uniref:Uncharacterized protein n=1 Tax=Polyplax serrata TaxID=468196 RepID=A0AAN8SCT2_POLSC